MAVAAKKEASEAQKQGKPDEAKLQKSVIAARKVIELQDSAASLKEKAKKAVDPRERLKLLQEAYDKEIEAFGQSKYAKRLQSGAWQGGVAGGGIGGGVALGLGTLVGTLVSSLVSVPTVVVGGLVGAGVGSIHGPFLKFGKGDGDKAAKSEEETRSAAMKEAERLDQAVERGASTVPQPPTLEDEDQSHHVEVVHSEETVQEDGQIPPKRRPRKLETRSGKVVEVVPDRKRPRKIQMRHAAETSEQG